MDAVLPMNMYVFERSYDFRAFTIKNEGSSSGDHTIWPSIP